MAHVGLVLGAGGLAGHAFHAGVLAALADAGWDARTADLIVGTSAGSGVGTHLRAGVPPRDLSNRLRGQPLSPEGAELLARVPRPPRAVPRTGWSWPLRPQAPGLLASRAARPWTLRPGHVLAALAPEGRQPTEFLQERIRLVHPDRWPDRPLWLVAARLRDGSRVVFGRDPAPDADVAAAVAASSAIPGWFAPVVIGGERFVDGGIHSPTNADLVAGLELDLVIVSAPMASAAGRPEPARVYHTALLEREVRQVRAGGTRVLVFAPDRSVLEAMGFDPMDPSTMRAIAEASEAVAAASLADVELPSGRRAGRPSG
jgi:NTE family protein